MPANKLWLVLRRFQNQLTKAKNRPATRFRAFSRSLSTLLKTTTTPPGEIVTSLLREGLRHEASDIHVEPADEGSLDIYFRIGGLLHKAAIVRGAEAPTLRAALQSQSHSPRLGQYGVRESTLTISDQEKQVTFSLCDIPQTAEHCLLIRPCIPGQVKTTGSAVTIPPHPRRNIDKKIFIWQMGKVGSLSIYTSLLRYSQPTSWRVPSIQHDTDWPRHNNILQTHSVKLLYDFLHYSDEEFVIISLVRDLMARNISTIFQSMNFKEEWRNHFYIASKAEFKKMPYEQQEREITKRLHTLNTSSLATGWYDNLLRSHFYYPDIERYQIDIYAKPFDQEKGFQIYESKTPRVQVIILRLEDLNACSKELGIFLGIEGFQLAWGNAPDGKWYEPTYKRFKERYRPTAQEIEVIYNSRFMRYFYSPEQIGSLIQKWRS